LKPDYTDYLDDSPQESLYYRLSNWFASANRKRGPGTLPEVSVSAQRRWLENPKNLKDKTRYRPPTLGRVKPLLNKLDPAHFGLGETVAGNAQYTMYQVQRGDSLRAIAKTLLGSPDQADQIYKANLSKLDSPDRIYPGQMLRIPRNQS
jgi:nucleoid-associated protein YgaU